MPCQYEASSRKSPESFCEHLQQLHEGTPGQSERPLLQTKSKPIQGCRTMPGPCACLVPGCPVRSNETDENSKYNAMPLRMGYRVCMRHFQRDVLLDRTRLGEAMAASPASTTTIYYNFQTTHPVGDDVYELAAVSDRNADHPFLRHVSTAKQGPFNRVGVGMTIKEALVDFLQWIEQTCDQQPSQKLHGPLHQNLDGHQLATPSIILVAHYGSGFAHEVLVGGLRDHGLVSSASHLRLCDSLIAFKALRGMYSPCKLPFLAQKLAPKYDPPEGCAMSHAVALQEVSNAFLSAKPFSSQIMWQLFDCPLTDFAQRIGISTSHDSAQQTSFQQDIKHAVAPSPVEAVGSQPTLSTAAAPAALTSSTVIKEQDGVASSQAEFIAVCNGEDQPDRGLEPPPKRRAVGTMTSSPDRPMNGPVTPPAVVRSQPCRTGRSSSPCMQPDAEQVSDDAASMNTKEAGSLPDRPSVTVKAELGLQSSSPSGAADQQTQPNGDQDRQYAIGLIADGGSMTSMRSGASNNGPAELPSVKVEMPTQPVDAACMISETCWHRNCPSSVKTEPPSQAQDMA
ncbi:hypothetical protein WJX74_010254 [Apatococcus lobatus]|uniref:Uncharacterized protein n=1 Tax=Apatococcus lobatus TaxID=904363 RepID=A0AAW1Q8V2_9CHLO